MKNSFAFYIFFLSILLNQTISVNCQDSKGYSHTIENKKIEQKYKLESSSTTKEIKVKVVDNQAPDHRSYIKVTASTSVSKGNLEIQLINPNGITVGKIELGDTSTHEIELEEAIGKLTKEFYNPMPGNWTVKVIPKQCSAKILLIIEENTKPTNTFWFVDEKK